MADDQTKPGAPADVATLSFEAAMKELETIVAQLERGDVPLEQSIAIYERGETLKKRCEALLAQAEERVERIRVAEGRAVGTGPFNTDR